MSGLTALRNLDLYHCQGLGSAGLQHVSGLTALQSLNVNDCRGIMDAGLRHLSQLTALTRLELDFCNISASGLHHLSGLSMLQRLNLDWDTYALILNAEELEDLPENVLASALAHLVALLGLTSDGVAEQAALALHNLACGSSPRESKINGLHAFDFLRLLLRNPTSIVVKAALDTLHAVGHEHVQLE